jgi:HAE1 family hydrophobic/amphiphilic exporter-1
MTLFLMPTVYYLMNRGSDERAAKAEARRERIAAGLSRKDAKSKKNAVDSDTEAAKLIESDSGVIAAGDAQVEGAGI